MRTENEDVFEAFVAWKAAPDFRLADDAPDTMQEFAEVHGVSVRTLYRWQKTDDYKEKMREIAEQHVVDAIPQILEASKEVASEPGREGQRDREMLLELADMLGSEVTVRHEGAVEHLHSMDEARAMDEDALRRAFRKELRQKPALSDKTDEELDAIIDALATTGEAEELPTAEGEENYVLVEPHDEEDLPA